MRLSSTCAADDQLEGVQVVGGREELLSFSYSCLQSAQTLLEKVIFELFRQKYLFRYGILPIRAFVAIDLSQRPTAQGGRANETHYPLRKLPEQVKNSFSGGATYMNTYCPPVSIGRKIVRLGIEAHVSGRNPRRRWICSCGFCAALYILY